jgi:hypothetical protein
MTAVTFSSWYSQAPALPSHSESLVGMVGIVRSLAMGGKLQGALLKGLTVSETLLEVHFTIKGRGPRPH